MSCNDDAVFEALKVLWLLSLSCHRELITHILQAEIILDVAGDPLASVICTSTPVGAAFGVVVVCLHVSSLGTFP